VNKDEREREREREREEKLVYTYISQLLASLRVDDDDYNLHV
jgi:hypothetical protein